MPDEYVPIAAPAEEDDPAALLPGSLEEFEGAYADRLGVTVTQLHGLGYHAEPHDCVEHTCDGRCSGFHMIDPPAPEPEPTVEPAPDDDLIVHDG